MLIIQLIAVAACFILTGEYIENNVYWKAALFGICGILWIIMILLNK